MITHVTLGVRVIAAAVLGALAVGGAAAAPSAPTTISVEYDDRAWSPAEEHSGTLAQINVT